MVLNYCDDQIWLSPDDRLIEECVCKLKKLGYDLTLEKDGDVFGFLGIDKRVGSSIVLTQHGLIDKVIKYVDLQNSNSKSTPAATTLLGSDKDGKPFVEEWSYPAAVGMLLYLSSNTKPDIQFAVHQVAQFSHNPKESHVQAIKHIVSYVLGTKTKGVEFEPHLKAGLDCYVEARRRQRQRQQRQQQGFMVPETQLNFHQEPCSVMDYLTSIDDWVCITFVF